MATNRTLNIKLPVVFSYLLLLLTLFTLQAKADFSPVPEQTEAKGKSLPKIGVPFNLEMLKKNWRERITAIRKSGMIPIIDIESNYTAKKLDPNAYAGIMDENGIALIAFSASPDKKKYQEKGKVWTDDVRKLIHIDPYRYIPVSATPGDPMWSESPGEFLDETFSHVRADGYPLMAEFEFRHYMSGKQYRQNQTHRDLDIPIDGEYGERLFAFAAESGVPFQIHLDIEDGTVQALEKMLRKYPAAKVIWCHFSQVRYLDKNSIYGPAYIRKLIDTYPNLYFDMAFGLADQVYPGSGERDARIWDQNTQHFKTEWKQIIEQHPWRFLAAFDIGGNRHEKLASRAKKMRRILQELSPASAEIVAYRAAWKLLFNEAI